MLITKIKGRMVLDSRGIPTVEAEIFSNKISAKASVPSGASTGSNEALELRDNAKEFLGKGVSKAIDNINKIIAPKLIGINAADQETIDKIMLGLDGTKQKSKLGANAILAVSIACCKLAAKLQNMPTFMHIAKLAKEKPKRMPIPMLNLINGGKHAGLSNDIQEHMIMPLGFDTFYERLKASVEIYQTLKKMLKKAYGARAILLADEGGFVWFKNSEERLEFLQKAIENANYSLEEIKFALDCAATEFFKDGKYFLYEKEYNAESLLEYYSSLCNKFPISSIEDPFAENDFEGFAEALKKLKIQIVADDLVVTNAERLKLAIKHNACNAIILKPNQIGTITETLQTAKLAKENNIKIIASHRSGETEDSFIADLCIGINAEFCKFGAPARSDRNAKYNQLLRIEEMLK